MPNWVYNKLLIENKEDYTSNILLEKFKDEESSFSFQKIIPRPLEFEEGDKWYDWNISNWGTKWNSNVHEINHTDNGVEIIFSTPWSPPLPVIEFLSKILSKSNLNLHYREEQGWGGEIKFTNGDLEVISEWDIPSSHKEMSMREECYCFSADEMFFEDCFTERAKEIKGITEKELEIIKSLSSEWVNGFENLLKTARKL